jgi:hypothetical protein
MVMIVMALLVNTLSIMGLNKEKVEWVLINARQGC